MTALVATIRYPKDDRILALFAAEEKILSRSQYEVSESADAIIFTVQASDATALRAALSTITKVLSVWEATAVHGRSRAEHA